MTTQELEFRTELLQLLNKHHAQLEEYNDQTLPEMGFSANYRSLRVHSDKIDLDLFRLAEKLKS